MNRRGRPSLDTKLQKSILKTIVQNDKYGGQTTKRPVARYLHVILVNVKGRRLSTEVQVQLWRRRWQCRRYLYLDLTLLPHMHFSATTARDRSPPTMRPSHFHNLVHPKNMASDEYEHWVDPHHEATTTTTFPGEAGADDYCLMTIGLFSASPDRASPSTHKYVVEGCHGRGKYHTAGVQIIHRKELGKSRVDSLNPAICPRARLCKVASCHFNMGSVSATFISARRSDAFETRYSNETLTPAPSNAYPSPGRSLCESTNISQAPCLEHRTGLTLSRNVSHSQTSIVARYVATGGGCWSKSSQMIPSCGNNRPHPAATSPLGQLHLLAGYHFALRVKEEEGNNEGHTVTHRTFLVVMKTSAGERKMGHTGSEPSLVSRYPLPLCSNDAAAYSRMITRLGYVAHSSGRGVITKTETAWRHLLLYGLAIYPLVLEGSIFWQALL
ncbi:hypothetical protein FPV67DRAFT_1450112 [Lyophyllum atratum]|nr:hypothetical protein FPV67DRAFT_1450112 [Lyophyllum atratum]